MGQSSLSRAKSLSGVGTVSYTGIAPALDRATTRKLLDLFDKKKNWMFQDMGEGEDSGDAVEEWSREGNLLGTEGGRRNPYGKSRSVVHDFLRSSDEEKRPRKNNKRHNRPEPMPGEDEEEKRAEPEFELNTDEFKEGGKKRSRR